MNGVVNHLGQITRLFFYKCGNKGGGGGGGMYLIILWISWDELRTAGCHLWPARKDPMLLMGSTATYVSVNEHVLRDNKRVQIYLPRHYKPLNLSGWTFYIKIPKPPFSKLNINLGYTRHLVKEANETKKDVAALALNCHRSSLKRLGSAVCWWVRYWEGHNYVIPGTTLGLYRHNFINRFNDSVRWTWLTASAKWSDFLKVFQLEWGGARTKPRKGTLKLHVPSSCLPVLEALSPSLPAQEPLGGLLKRGGKACLQTHLILAVEVKTLKLHEWPLLNTQGWESRINGLS